MLRNLLFLIPLLSFLYSCKSDKSTPANNGQAKTATVVEVFIAKPEILDNVITTHGSVMSNEEIELRSEVAGKIESINFKEGGKVSKDQLLVQINDSELQPNLEKLKVQLRIAQDEFGRKKQLFDIQGISKEEYEAAELKVASLESDIRLIDAQIRNSKIIAPFSGTVGLRQVSPGAFVTAGGMIAKLVQSDPVKIEFTVPEMYAHQISTGSQVQFKLAGSDKNFTAKVYALDPSIDPATRSLKVRAIADNKDGALIPGAYAELTITLQQIKDGLLVPALAVTQDIKGLKLFVIKNGQAVTKLVKTGIQKGDFVQITEGMEAGDTVITTSLLSMRDGVPVLAKGTAQQNGGTAK
ncbi:MAG: efflux RND transporter periplasmic adaptor subunit [Chitinophagales bacterium]|nr:efflux RND transporter periplasmic adaptor subunit [Chitinophagales bacterium]